MTNRGRPAKPKDEKFVRFTVSLPPDLVSAVKEASKESGEAMSAIVAAALEAELKRRKGSG